MRLESKTAAAAERELNAACTAAFGDASFLHAGLPALTQGNIISGLETS